MDFRSVASLAVAISALLLVSSSAASATTYRDGEVQSSRDGGRIVVQRVTRHCRNHNGELNTLWTAAAIHQLLPALPNKPMTRQLCSLGIQQSQIRDDASLLHFVSDRQPVMQQEVDELEPSPLDRLLPYLEKDAAGGLGTPQAAIPSYDEAEERRRIGSEAIMLYEDDEESLKLFEELLEGYRKSDERMGSGISKLTVVYEFIKKARSGEFMSERRRDDRLAFIDRWQKRLPNSIDAKIMRAHELRQYAFSITRQSRNDPTIRGAKEKMKERLIDLISYLESIKEPVARLSDEWHSLMIEARGVQGATVADLFKLADEASQHFPVSTSYFVYAVEAVGANSKHPAKDLDALAVLLSIRGAREGESAFYARTYWTIINRVFGAHRVQEMSIDWARFSAGAREIIDKYPVQWNVQHYTAFLCFGGDFKSVNELFPLVKGRPIRKAWGDITVHDACRTWAEDKVNRLGKQGGAIEN